MHFFVAIAILVASAISAHGELSPGASGPPGSNDHCLNSAQAQKIVSQYTSLLQEPMNVTAQEVLADCFTVYSDSISFLGSVLSKSPNTFQHGAQAYKSKQDFISRAADTPAIPTVTTKFYFHNCHQIAWLWTGSGITKSPQSTAVVPTVPEQVNGIITMNIADGQIEAVYSEFNTGSWLFDTGSLPITTT